MKKLLTIAATLVVAVVAGCAKQAPAAPQSPAMDNTQAVNYKGKPTPMYKVQQLPEERPNR